jgi:peptidoglycan/LPS O-acetylase OafA/YrhL
MELGYRPALDGLRAVAIALVVSLHAFRWPNGGYLGVDLFFVLSGFLITTLLFEEHRRTGRISLSQFYVRRARRLLPALFVLLAAYSAWSLATQGVNPIRYVLEGVFYCTNLFLAYRGQTSPIEHLWSLAEEEQFYLLWPVLLIALLVWRRRFVGIFLIVSFAMLVWNEVWQTQHHANGLRLDYGIDTRADGLVVGCLLAAYWGRVPLWIVRWFALLGAPVVAYLLVTLTPTDPTLHLGRLAFVSVWFASIVQLATADGVVTWVLSQRPLVWLGGISYALYLWHIPVLVAERDRLGATVCVLIALVLATLSTYFVEKPFRRGQSAHAPPPEPAGRRIPAAIVSPVVAGEHRDRSSSALEQGRH